jgi:hypothetical protein
MRVEPFPENCTSLTSILFVSLHPTSVDQAAAKGLTIGGEKLNCARGKS